MLPLMKKETLHKKWSPFAERLGKLWLFLWFWVMFASNYLAAPICRPVMTILLLFKAV